MVMDVSYSHVSLKYLAYTECKCVSSKLESLCQKAGKHPFLALWQRADLFPHTSNSLLPLAPAEQDDIALSTNGVIP